MNSLPHWAEAVAAVLLVAGGLFALVGAIGLARFGDFFMRLHAPTKATTLGVGGVLAASLVLRWVQGSFGAQELLITLFLFVTAPVSANLMAKAALHLRLRSKAPLPPAQDRAASVGASPASPAAAQRGPGPQQVYQGPGGDAADHREHGQPQQ
jgi:multicomponent K+:H+ antiporter subunit G